MRFTPPLAILFAAVLAAAPVPRDQAAVSFGANGLLTSEDLKTVRFNSKPARTAEELKGLQLKPGERPEDYDAAVHLPRTRILHGEPIPAFFVVKNATKRKLGLKMLLEFAAPECRFRGETDLQIKCLTPGVEASLLMAHCTHCSADPLVEIPANGFWVAHGDLTRLGAEPLPPGEYQVEWTCQVRAAEPVRFTVLPGNGAAIKPSPQPDRHRFLAIQPDDAQAGKGDTFAWSDFGMEPIRAVQMAASLGVGLFGKYVPDYRTIPATDGKLIVRASLRREKDIEKLIVTLDSKDPRTPVEFEDVPKVYLHIEEKSDNKSMENLARALRDEMRRAEPRLRTPMIIEVPFDAERWKEAGFAEGRVAAIVTSGKLEFPRRGRELEKLQARLDIRSVGRDPASIWTGVLRSEFLPLNSRVRP